MTSALETATAAIASVDQWAAEDDPDATVNGALAAAVLDALGVPHDAEVHIPYTDVGRRQIIAAERARILAIVDTEIGNGFFTEGTDPNSIRVAQIAQIRARIESGEQP